MAFVRPFPRPLVSPFGDPLRGSGLPWESADGGSAPYEMLTDAGLIAWFDARTLSAGSVASWLDRKASYDAAQSVGAARPVCSADALSSGYQGVVFTNDGLAVAAGAGSALANAISALTAIDVYVVAMKNAVGAAALCEYGTTGNGFAIVVDDGVNDTVEFLGTRGGLGAWRSSAGTASLADVALVFGGFDTAQSTITSTRRLDEVELAGANVATGSTVGAFTDDLMFSLGSRNNGVSLAFDGALFQVVLFTTGTTAQRRNRAGYLAAIYGLTIP